MKKLLLALTLCLAPIAVHAAASRLPAEAATLPLHNTSGTAVSAENFKGKPSLVFFGYTSCEDECPQALNTLTAAVEELSPAQMQAVQVVMITVDPVHDTSAVLRSFLNNFNPGFEGWSGHPAEVEVLARQFLAYSGQTAPQHPAEEAANAGLVYVLNARGEHVAHFGSKEDPSAITQSLLPLLPKSKK